MANPNLATAGSIYGGTGVLAAGTSSVAIVSNSTASGKILKVNSLLLANTTTGNVDVTVDLFRSGTAYKIANAVSVPSNATLAVLSKDSPVYLVEGDSLRVVASATASLSAVCSYEELS
jgi:hypothetical protein